MEAFQAKVAERLCTGNRFDSELNSSVCQNLPIGRSRAQARRQIDDRAAGRIMRPALIADVSQSGMACCNPDAEAELVAVPAPFLRQPADPAAHLNRHAYSTRRRIGTGQRIIKNDKKAVPRK